MQPKLFDTRKVVPHVPGCNRHGPPPPRAGHRLSRWEQLPAANRRRLLWLLSQLLERQLGGMVTPKEAGDDADDSGE
jgi:hypothetical protein